MRVELRDARQGMEVTVEEEKGRRGRRHRRILWKCAGGQLFAVTQSVDHGNWNSPKEKKNRWVHSLLGPPTPVKLTVNSSRVLPRDNLISNQTLRIGDLRRKTSVQKSSRRKGWNPGDPDRVAICTQCSNQMHLLNNI